MATTSTLRIGIIGGSGYLGRNLARHILAKTDWHVTIIARDINVFSVDAKYANRITFVEGDVLDEASITSALTNIDVAYYFVHMMGQAGGNFYEKETTAANMVSRAVAQSSVTRLIYMGGLGRGKELSKHLASRQHTGAIFRALPIDVIEFRASMIIGRGSVAFEIIAKLVSTLPIMVLPKSANTRTQPIALPDALEYLLQAADVSIAENTIVEIGGSDVVSYADLYRAYAHHVRKHRFVVRAPFIPAWLEARFLDLFAPKVQARIGQAMVESLDNEMIVTAPTNTEQLFPSVRPRTLEATLDAVMECVADD